MVGGADGSGESARDTAAALGGVFIALGSNLGDRAGHLRAALQGLESAGDIRIRTCSALHETVPVGGPPGQPQFLNAVAELATALPPRRLLARLLDLERASGRARGEPNGPRTLDLDLLLYRDQVIDEPGLTVPHPRMWQRAFVQAPLREICGAARYAALRAAWSAHAPESAACS